MFSSSSRVLSSLQIAASSELAANTVLSSSLDVIVRMPINEALVRGNHLLTWPAIPEDNRQFFVCSSKYNGVMYDHFFFPP